MADGQDELNTLAAQPVNPVQQVPSAPTTAMLPQATAADVLAGIQAAQNTPAPTNVMPQNTMTAAPNLPAQPAADVHEHFSMLHRILDRVGTILGGGETLHATKDADGNMSVTRDPSTTGEKWGRVAAAALGGLAQGLQNAQGPGGMARAAAAGTQYGLQLPQQQRQQVQQEATFENQQLLAKANRIHLTQQNYMLAQQAKLNDLQINQQSTDSLGKYLDTLRSSPNAMDLGPIDPSDPNAAMNAAKKNPEAMDGLLGRNNKVLQPVLAPDHKMHLIVTDAGWEQQRSTQPIPLFDVGKDADGRPTLTSTQNAPPGTKVADVTAFNLGQQTKYYQFLKSYADAEKSEQDKTEKLPTTYEGIVAAANLEKDPTRKTQLMAAANQLRTTELRKFAPPTVNISGLPSAPGAIAGAQFGGGETNSSFETTSQKLADGTLLLSELPSRGAKGQPTRQDYIARADQIDRANGGTGYTPAQAEQENKFAANPKVQAAVNGIDRIIAPNGQFDQLLRLTDKAKLDHAAPINALTLRANKFLGDQDAKNFLTGLEETRRSIAGLMGNPLLGGSETDRKLQQAQDMLGENPTRDNIRSAHDVLTQALATQRQAMVDNNRFLRRRFGATGNAPVSFAPSTTPAQNAPPINLVPAGHDTTFANGQVWRNVNGVATRIK